MWSKAEEIDYGEPVQHASTNKEWLLDWEQRDKQIAFEDVNYEFKDSGEGSMLFKETGKAIDFEPAPPGMHIARCIRIIDLGTTMDLMYNKDKHDVFFMWELPAEMKTYIKDEKTIVEPFTIGKYYNMSLSEGSHLRADLESWRSKPFTEKELQGFDPQKIVGITCMLNIVHKPRKKKKGVTANIVSITPLVKGLECPPQANPSVYLSLDITRFDQSVFEALSSGLKTRVIASHEYQAMVNPQTEQAEQPESERHPPPIDDGFDDIPF